MSMSGSIGVVFAVVVISLIGGCMVRGCGQNYSDGERVGVVTKLSNKGLIWKSWEGELLMALPVDVAGTTQPEKFIFNVSPACVERVQQAMKSGKRVTLVYTEWVFCPITIENDHVVTDVK